MLMAFRPKVSVLLTVWIGGRLAIEGKIEPGNITEFILYVFRLTWPFASLGWVTSLVQRAVASQQRINEFLNVKPGIVNHNAEQYSFRGDIEFKNVSFTYPENQVQALHQVSFKVKAGQTIGITGKVGSGKSTILSLLTRLYDATEGEICIDGKNIRDHNLHLMRKQCGVVPQEVFLFSDTIANNISFGSHAGKAEQALIEKAAMQAEVHKNILDFPEGYQTMVGERGVTLSGGQKQRVSIARALINKPRFLYFDDCLSAVDSETEERILSHLKSELASATGILISHRVSTLKTADYILYLEGGKVVESGTHEELMALRKRYFELEKLQTS